MEQRRAFQRRRPAHGESISLGDGGTHMTILIDADGCPVVDLTLQIAKRFSVPVILILWVIKMF
jgi:hypothetical protein